MSVSDTLFTVVSFLVALSILIAVHEYGHFWVARKAGVKVLRFSIGFGKQLWSYRGRVDGTEYSLSAIPLGGYVKMLDEREGEVAAEELHRAFNRQPVAKRFAIVAAGPGFNLIFAIFAYWLVFINGVPGLVPVVGEVIPQSVGAEAGIRSGEQVTAVAGVETPTWEVVLDRILPYALRKEAVEVALLTPEGEERRATLDFSTIVGEPEPETIVTSFGLRPRSPAADPVVAEVMPESPAQQAGLQAGDRILAIDNQPIKTWEDLHQIVLKHPGQPLRFSVERGGAPLTLEISPEAIKQDDQTFGRIGASAQVDQSLLTELRYSPLAAVAAAADKTWDMAKLTLWSLQAMVTGQLSMKNISGPVTIAIYAKESASMGISRFLSFLGLLSVSLAVLNLLPVPVLDGGHLMFYVAESIKGSPLSERVEALGQKIGLAFILALMTIALYNDLTRLFG